MDSIEPDWGAWRAAFIETGLGDAPIPANLARLGAVCVRIKGVPLAEPSWEHGLSADEARRWVPDPGAPESFDTQLVTELGVLDVVPSLCGTYDELAPEAMVAPDGVCFAPVEPIVDRMRRGPRRKDLERGSALQQVAPTPRALTEER